MRTIRFITICAAVCVALLASAAQLLAASAERVAETSHPRCVTGLDALNEATDMPPAATQTRAMALPGLKRHAAASQ
jgi:hypothetical protein